MQTVSLCMIVRNEEAVLGRCLDSAAGLVDEIVIVDTGSTDGTKETAARYTEKIFDFPWRDDFAAARNAAFGRASCDYCMWLDADDVLEEPDREAFRRLKASLTPEVDVVMMPYHTGFDGAGNVTFSYYRERIVKNHRGMVWKGAVHEAIETRGNVIYASCAVSHRKEGPGDPDRNLRIFTSMLERGETLGPREQYYYGRELLYHSRWAEALAVLEGFLDSGLGWVENRIDACCLCAQCYGALGEEEAALRALFRSFAYGLPRAEVCCAAGARFFRREDWEQAAYWYRRALDCRRQDRSGGFVQPDAYGFLPCIQLCVCASRMGREQEAEAWNERAAAFKPDDPAVVHNRAWFASRRAEGA